MKFGKSYFPVIMMFILCHYITEMHVVLWFWVVVYIPAFPTSYFFVLIYFISCFILESLTFMSCFSLKLFPALIKVTCVSFSFLLYLSPCDQAWFHLFGSLCFMVCLARFLDFLILDLFLSVGQF